jgi:hypothetical protein
MVARQVKVEAFAKMAAPQDIPRMRSVCPMQRCPNGKKLSKANQTKQPLFSGCADPAILTVWQPRMCKQTRLSEYSSNGKTWSRWIPDWSYDRANPLKEMAIAEKT